MAKLPKFSLYYNKQKEGWALKNDKTNRIVKVFVSKEKATVGGVLEKVLGKNGGSVKIKKLTGKIQEERTFPPEKDPRESRG